MPVTIRTRVGDYRNRKSDLFILSILLASPKLNEGGPVLVGDIVNSLLICERISFFVYSVALCGVCIKFFSAYFAPLR